MEDRRHGADQPLRAGKGGRKARLSHQASVDHDVVSVDGGLGGEQEVRARVQSGARLDADDAALSEDAIDVVDGARYR